MTMTYTEALRKSRGLNKTAALPELEGWQRAGTAQGAEQLTVTGRPSCDP